MRPASFVYRLAASAIAGAIGSASALADDPPPQPALVAPAPPQVVLIQESPPHRLHPFGDVYHWSPGLAAALSLTPVPVDFGNFYAQNLEWGIAYTSAEIALMSGMMWLGASHMCHHDSGGCGDWSDTERNTMIAFVSGYVVIKLVAGAHAATAAQEHNRERPVPAWQPAVVPTSGGAVFSCVGRF